MSWLSLANLAAYCLQIAALAGAGALLARLFRIRASTSSATLGYWRALLAACLLLPFCQPWQTPRALAVRERVPLEASSDMTSEPLAGLAWPSPQAVLAVVGAGVLARAGWLALGLYGLHRLRRRAVPVPAGRLPIESAQERLGARAEFHISTQTSMPITFGLLRPVVLLPPGVLEMPTHAQEAILYHELIHVRRRDWLQALGEEAVRALLWFHPAVWWLIGRIHLTREQVVDQAVIALTRAPERYVEALLEMARARQGPQLIPAPLFLRRGLLKKRVAEIYEEATMTRRRWLLSLAACASLLLVAAVGAVWTFPMKVEAAALPEGGEGEPAEGKKAQAPSSPEQLKHVMEELKNALADPSATPEQKAKWKERLAEVEAKLSRGKTEREPEKAHRAEREIKELEKALQDPQLSDERKAELKERLRDLKLDAAKRKPVGMWLFRPYDPAANYVLKDKC